MFNISFNLLNSVVFVCVGCIEWTDTKMQVIGSISQLEITAYPIAERKEIVILGANGRQVHAPYHWMGDLKSKKTLKFIKEQNETSELYSKSYGRIGVSNVVKRATHPTAKLCGNHSYFFHNG